MQQIRWAVFSSVRSLVSSDKRRVEISQNLHQIVELICRIESLLQSWSSTPLQVTFVCPGSFQIFVEAKVDSSTSKLDIVKEILSKCSLPEPRAATLTHTRSCHCFVFVAWLHLKCYTEWTKVAPLSMQLPKAATLVRSFKIHKNTAQHCRKKLCIFSLNQPVQASCVSPGALDLVATFSELSLWCSDCCVERKWFFFSNLVMITWKERSREGVIYMIIYE